jgi:radical SAM protein with 4Fe4S-binding SPASM domain
MPFYMMVVEPDGNVVPCCSSEIPISYGNVTTTNIVDMWNGERRNQFLLLQLEDMTMNKVCSNCSVPKYGLQEGDYLDSARNTLLDTYRRCYGRD